MKSDGFKNSRPWLAPALVSFIVERSSGVFYMKLRLCHCWMLTAALALSFDSGPVKSFFPKSRSHRVMSSPKLTTPAKRPAEDDEDGLEPGLTTKQHVYTARYQVPRYEGPAADEMTLEQTKIRDAIVQSRPRTGLSGPFGPWLAVPAIAEPAQALGRACRYGTSLSFRESELVILLTGAKTRSPAEFDIHVGEAIKAGYPWT